MHLKSTSHKVEIRRKMEISEQGNEDPMTQCICGLLLRTSYLKRHLKGTKHVVAMAEKTKCDQKCGVCGLWF
jgi:hypothetical protein